METEDHYIHKHKMGFDSHSVAQSVDVPTLSQWRNLTLSDLYVLDAKIARAKEEGWAVHNLGRVRVHYILLLEEIDQRIAFLSNGSLKKFNDLYNGCLRAMGAEKLSEILKSANLI